MFCDFCGKKLSGAAKYCRYCGRQMPFSLEDTQPLSLPLVGKPERDGGVRPLTAVTEPPRWYQSILPRKPLANRSRMGRILYDGVAIGIVITVLYILATFKAVREYQALTGLWGGMLLLYVLWKR